jgi:hypothetical protein
MYEKISTLRGVVDAAEETQTVQYFRSLLCVDPANPTEFENELVNKFLTRQFHSSALANLDDFYKTGAGKPCINGQRFKIIAEDAEGNPIYSTDVD